MITSSGAEGIFALAIAVLSVAGQVFIVVLGVVIAWRWLHRPEGLAATPTQMLQKTAFEILDERYARGEIEANEYEVRRSQLLRRP